MGLRDLKLPSDSVKIPGNEPLVLRGLGLADCSAIMQRHGGVLEKVYLQEFSEKIADDDLRSASNMAKTLLEMAPLAVAHIIACSAGDPEAEDVAAKLPVGVQIEAFTKIMALTFESEEAAKKLLETVISGTTMFTRMVSRVDAPIH